MANVLTAAAVDKEQLLLQIELAKVQRDIKEMEMKLVMMNHEYTKVVAVHADETTPLQATTPGQRLEKVPLVEDCGEVQASNESSQSIHGIQKIDEWLEKDQRARRTLILIGEGGKYNPEKKNIEGHWVTAFKEGWERRFGQDCRITDKDRWCIQRLREKCTTENWNYERVYNLAFHGADPANIFQKQAESMPRSTCKDVQEEKMHSQFRIAADVRLIGRRRNISPLASDDHDLYYIAKGSVYCTGERKLCRCPEGCVEVMVQEIFPHDGPLQKYGGECHEELPTHVLKVNNNQSWLVSLVRHAPKENIRTKSKQSDMGPKKVGKENKVRRSTRQPTFSSKVLEIINTGVHSRSAKVGSKRGRKRKGGAPGRTIEASKPVISVVERPGKRRTTKLALN